MSDNADITVNEDNAKRIAEALAYVCIHIGGIKAFLSEETIDRRGLQALEQIQSALQRTGDISRPLGELHHALVREGDVLGVYGHARGLRDLTLVGFEDEPLEIVYRCPTGRCLRTVPGPAVVPPCCGMTGETMQWGHL